MQPGPAAAASGVSILVPTLNEAENMAPLFAAIAEACAARFEYEVVVIDDGSTDGTRDRVLAAGAPVRLVARDEPTGGLTGAVVAGAAAARFETVVIIDGDLSHPASAVPDLVAPILDGSRDVVVGSRHVPGGGMPGWPLYRRIVSKIAAWMAWPLVDVRDPMSGFLAMRRERLLSVDPAAKGFKVGLEVMAAGRDRVRVAEVPILFRDRTWGESKLKSSTIYAYLTRLVALAGGRTDRSGTLRLLLASAFGMVADVVAIGGLTAAGQPMRVAQLAGAAIATALAYALNSRWLPDPGVAGLRRCMRAASIGLLGAILRAGVLGWGMDAAGHANVVALLAGASALAFVNYVGNVFYVFAGDPGGGRRIMRWRVAAVGVFAYMLALRLVYAGIVDLVPEEAYYWTYAQHPALSYLDHPPMVAWLTWLGTAIFGDTEFGVRFPAIACGVIAALFLYRLTVDLYDKASGLVALLLMSCFPYAVAAGFLAAPDAPLVACWAGALYFFQRALVAGRPSGWWGAGVCVGVGMLSKYTVVLLGPAAALFMIIVPGARRWWRRPEPYLAGGLALLVFSPVLVWNAQNAWASFVFQGTRRVAEGTTFTTHRILVSALVMVTPLGLAAAIRAMGKPVADGQDAGRDRLRRAYLMVFTLVPLAVFVFFSLFMQSKGYWTGPTLLGVVPLIAAMVLYSTRIDRARALSRAWAANVLIAMMVLASMLQYASIGWPGVGYDKGMRLPMGWREMGSTTAALERRVASETGAWPRVVGINKYTLAAETNFYRRRAGREPSMSGNLFGRDALMFETWGPAGDAQGRDLVLVSFEHEDLVDERVMRRIARAEPIVWHKLYRYGREIGTFATRVVYGYRPDR